MRTLLTLVWCCVVLLAVTSTALAAGPLLIGFQGRLTDSTGTPLVGTYSVRFAIYDSLTATSAAWMETQSVTTSADGFLSVHLGSVVALPVSALDVNDKFLGIKVGSDPELAPRSQLVSVPYAYFTKTVHGASGGSILGGLNLTGHLEANAEPFFSAMRAVSAVNFGFGNNTGVYALAANSPSTNYGVYALAYDAGPVTNSAAIYGEGFSFGGTIWAGYFDGWANVTGNLYAGAKFFRIDDPTDPTHRTLQHACVESDQFKNVYDGVITTDATGHATVTLPDWFEALNKDFRYQLTPIGQFAQLIISREVAHHEFEIASDKPHVKVSWMITGVRKDPYALAHGFQPQQDKPAELVGTYLHPVEYGVDEKLGVDYAAREYGRQMAKEKAQTAD